MSSLIVQIMLVFLAMGAAYGIGAGTITSMVDGINAVTKTFAGLSGLIFLLFVISQFLAYFTYSNMATIVAVNMGDALEHANLGTIPLMLGFITITGVVGMLIVGAIRLSRPHAPWARWRYSDRPKRMHKALERERKQRRPVVQAKLWLQHVIAGEPHFPADYEVDQQLDREIHAAPAPPERTAAGV